MGNFRAMPLKIVKSSIRPPLLAILVLSRLVAFAAGPVSAQESQDPQIVKVLGRA